jgi:type II secretory pathway component GspD/PulD (secretin)
MRKVSALSTIAILLLSTGAGAQRAGAPRPEADAPRTEAGAQRIEAGAQLNADPRLTNIFDLIEKLADEIDKEIIVDPFLPPELSVFTTADEPDYDSLLGALRLYGYAVFETADQILIIPEENMRTGPSRMLQEDDSRVSDHEVVTRVITLPLFPESSLPAQPTGAGDANPSTPGPAAASRASAVMLVPVLRPMMSTTAQLAGVMNGNSLVLVDRYDNVRRITAVVEALVDSFDD